MAIGLSDILSALQNGVQAIRSLNSTLQTVFPQSGTVSVTIPATGVLTFNSSQPDGFLLVTTSSGGIYSVPLYTP